MLPAVPPAHPKTPQGLRGGGLQAAPRGGSWGAARAAQQQGDPKARGAERRPGAAVRGCGRGSGLAPSRARGLYFPFSISPHPKAPLWLWGCSQPPMASVTSTGFGSTTNGGDSGAAVAMPRADGGRFRRAQTGRCPSCPRTGGATSTPRGGRQGAQSQVGFLRSCRLKPIYLCLPVGLQRRARSHRDQPGGRGPSPGTAAVSPRGCCGHFGEADATRTDPLGSSSSTTDPGPRRPAGTLRSPMGSGIIFGHPHPFPCLPSCFPTASASLRWPFNHRLQPLLSDFSARPDTRARILAA